MSNLLKKQWDSDACEKKVSRGPYSKEEIYIKLQAEGFRITKQRRVLIEIILENECACCKEIYYEAAKIIPEIGMATIYRVLNVLEDIHAIERDFPYRFCYKEKMNKFSVVRPGDTKEELSEKDFGNDGILEARIGYHDIIECITAALDAKDPYTAGHSKRVSEMAKNVCDLMGITDMNKERIHVAAHLHDIGKIGVSENILNKEGKLTEDEWNRMKKHAEIGAEILSKSVQLNEVKNIVLHHHERFDGKGYPSGLKGNEIPLGSRIIAICDSIDAMLYKRSYREAFSLEYCYNEIKENLGKMYDPIIGEYVLKNWDKIFEF